MAILLSANFIYSLMQSLVVPALTTIQREFDATATATAWLFTVFLLASSVSTPILGRLGDLFGRDKMLLLSLVFLMAGCGLAALAPSIGVLILARALQGLTGAVMPVSFGILRDELPEARVPGGIAAVASVLAVGSAVGIVLAGPVVEHLGWSWLFWLPLFAVVPVWVAIWYLIPASPNTVDGRVDIVGAVLLASWLVCVLLGVTQVPAWGWTSPAVIALFTAGVALAGVWIWVELRAAAPLVDIRVMRRGPIWRANAITFLTGVAMFSGFAFLPQFVQVPASTGWGLGMSATGAGITVLPWCITSAVTGFVTGGLLRRFGNRLVIVVGCGFAATSFVMLAWVHTSTMWVFAASAVLGIGIGILAAAAPNVIVETVDPRDVGVMTGMNSNIRSIGGCIGAQTIAAIIAAGALSNGVPSESSYVLGFTVLAIALVIAAGIAATLTSHDRPGTRVNRLAGDLTTPRGTQEQDHLGNVFG